MIGAIGAQRRATPNALTPPLHWRLRALPVCASTETQLDRWLADDPRLAGDGPLRAPRAVIARRQRFGRGQQGRPWCSPSGGVWLSAALPWPAAAELAAAPGLAAAVGLCLRLESRGLAVRIKWPNDLLLVAADGATPLKLAGLLPRLRLRGGACRWARVGVGLNAANRVPAGAVAVATTLLGPRRADPLLWCGEVLAALEWAMAWAGEPEEVRRQAERRLLLPAGPIHLNGEDWCPIGLTADGGLRLVHGPREQVLQRTFGAG
ncbi:MULTISPECIES: biotin--[acetyl-CoA-carboxylase] ligase [unclassified Cyanobium]|uniref:biotin--[acetyl-CoA-carboxylase] ligase n=1 Tax=unclassified Cyanobium TaxID=2627006 RepID=UPI0020CDB65C|nr:MULTISPECIES: biotin--[acetyl-CoA-carboxylase] ligase [unclassified Cyanobium]MCP9833531.1 biotin--[acetyl-CoA-carboxylase] ligase [Cyanobium sp. La Preciosa 7G6]MCP9936296.1 biotin--[acetyl-CoA-carboxylase] ligase [Cyanobium sp. Aljojuca 7A6]